MSGKVAKKEHAQIVEVLKYIQQLPPGLYGMDIEEHYDANGEVSYDVTLQASARSRTCARCRNSIASTRSRSEAVAALAELTERAYERTRAAGDARGGTRLRRRK